MHVCITDPAIVTDIVRDLFFHIEEVDAEGGTSQAFSEAGATTLFQVQPDNTFRVTIENSLHFVLVIQSIAAGCSFWQQTTKAMDLYHGAS